MNSIACKPSPVKQVAEWIARYELAFVALAAPVLLFPMLVPTQCTVLAALLFPLLWISRRISTGRFSVPTPLDGAIALLFLTALIGLCVSPDLSQSLPRFWAILLGVSVYYGLVNRLRTETGCRLAGDLLLVGGVGLAVLAVVRTGWQWVRIVSLPLYETLPTLSWEWLDGNLSNPRSVGMALAILLPVPLAHVLWGDRPRRRLFSGFAALVMAAVLLLTQSLQGLLGLGAALLVLAVWRSRWFLLAIPLGVGLCVLAVLVLGPQQVAVASLSVDHPLGIGVALRLDMWGRALALIRDLPYTGIGLEMFSLVQTGFYPGFIIGPEIHAHNTFLQVALDLGLPGLFAFLWLLVSFAHTVVVASRRSGDRDSQALLRGTTAGVAAYLGAGLIDAPWWIKPAVLLWVLLGVAVSLARLTDRQAWPSRRRWQVLPLVGLAALVALSLGFLPSLGALNLGSVQAHKVLAQVQTQGSVEPEGMARAASRLEQALQRQPDRSQTYRTLGRLYGWLEQHERALEALDRGVTLDGRNPMARYGPWVVWLHQLQGGAQPDRWDDLLWVYRHWMTRFPERAESYVQTALVWERRRGDQARARAVLESGLGNGAEPRGLLLYYLSQLD